MSHDAKFFSTTKKGEIHELKEELRTMDRGKRKAAVKKVIAAMTVGKDVSMLFPDVVNCMQTEDLELKKLVYLYLINYAKTQPDLAIMAVNTFVRDSAEPNPLIRALAVRTMGCIRVDKITEYLCDPLQRCLKDDDPYVRKTAAICVAKLFDINAELVQDRGFLDTLVDLLGDSNPMVVANALCALTEIKENASYEVVRFTPALLFKLLRALNECTEWGQVFILDALAGFQAESPKDAEAIIERVTPRLQHANSAVVLSAVKVIFRQLEVVGGETPDRALLRKITPSLVTLLAAEPEIQYVALRNIDIIVQRYPDLLANEVKVLFCRYNDPSYVKLEKLEIMVKLASAQNIDQVLMELKEYASEVDVEFVRKAVRAIGRCAVKLDVAAERCINVLVELIKGRVSYVVQEAVVVVRDIFRKYPNRYEGIISLLCENLDTLDEPEAKAAMVWVLGEYADRIDNADDLLEHFIDAFPEEPIVVQLQLVSAAVKLFLKKPTGKPQAMIQLVLTYATQSTDDPDLRDRAFIYWRLLSTDPEAAKAMVLAAKPTIEDTSSALEPALLGTLFANLGMLASVYQKPPEAFASRVRPEVLQVDSVEAPRAGDDSSVAASEDGTSSVAPSDHQPPAAKAPPPQVDNLMDLLDLGGDDEQPAAQATTTAPAGDSMGGLGLGLDELGMDDLAAPAGQGANLGADPLGADPLQGLGASAAAAPPPPPAQQPQQQTLLLPEAANGLSLEGAWVRGGNRSPALRLTARNGSGVTLHNFMVQFNKNAMGLAPASQTLGFEPIAPGATATAELATLQNQALHNPAAAAGTLQVAVKSDEQGVMYFETMVPREILA